MALDKKMDALARLRPNIAVLPEVAKKIKGPLATDRTYEWLGINPHKGLGVMAFSPFKVELACTPDRNLEWVLPLRIRGEVDFILLAAWAMNQRASGQASGPNRDRQVMGALQSYASLMNELPVVVAGDFNDNVIWDRPRSARSFAATLNDLQQRGLESAYHEFRGEKFGEESIPTIYWRDRKRDGPSYHIDYCFIPRIWMPYATVTVGSFDEWIAEKYSDHVPLIVDIELPT